MAASRISLADIARRADVHITTVSLALRDSPRLPATTKTRIQALAREMGYQPDPMLSALIAYRGNAKIKQTQGTLAWITGTKENAFSLYYQGARERCQELGYKLDHFSLREIGPTRLSKVLWARNIKGVLLAPQVRNRAHLNLTWEKFSAVTFGFTLVRPQLHVVTNAQYRSARMGMRMLRSSGYRRIGYVSTHNTEERTDQNFSAGFMIEQARFKKSERIPPLILKDYSQEEQIRDFSAWYRKHKPDAILDHYNQIVKYKRELGISHEQCALATLNRTTNETELAGIDQNDLVIGRTAVDFVVGMIHRNERGVPAIPFRILVQGTWVDGKSVIRRSGKAASEELAFSE